MAPAIPNAPARVMARRVIMALSSVDLMRSMGLRRHKRVEDARKRADGAETHQFVARLMMGFAVARRKTRVNAF
jgi:hypothetical protein